MGGWNPPNTKCTIISVLWAWAPSMIKSNYIYTLIVCNRKTKIWMFQRMFTESKIYNVHVVSESPSWPLHPIAILPDTHLSFTKISCSQQHLLYSRAHKLVIFCFAQLHLQILVVYQNQGQFWNLLVLRIPKLSLKVKFDKDLAEIIKVKDNWSVSKKCLLLDSVFDLH